MIQDFAFAPLCLAPRRTDAPCSTGRQIGAALDTSVSPVQADPNAAQLDSFDYYGTTYHYNGIPTIQAKTRIAMEKAGGIMFWALDHDAQGDLSLLNAIYEAANSKP